MHFSDLFSSHRRMGLKYRDIRIVEDVLVNLLYRDIQGNVKISLEKQKINCRKIWGFFEDILGGNCH